MLHISRHRQQSCVLAHACASAFVDCTPHDLPGGALPSCTHCCVMGHPRFSSVCTSRHQAVRTSKFRNIVCVEAKREQWYETDVSTEFEAVASSGTHVAFPSSASAGASVTVLPLSSGGARGAGSVTTRCHTAAVSALLFSPFSDTALTTGGGDGGVKVWHVTDGALAEVASLAASSPAVGGVTSLSYNPHAAGILAVGYGKGGAASVWDATVGRLTVNLTWGPSPSAGVKTHAIAWLPSGQQVATASSDKRVRVFDGRSGEVVQSFEAHQGTRPMRLAANHSDGLVLTAGYVPADISFRVPLVSRW
jgi:WD40 repeat protein